MKTVYISSLLSLFFMAGASVAEQPAPRPTSPTIVANPPPPPPPPAHVIRCTKGTDCPAPPPPPPPPPAPPAPPPPPPAPPQR